LDTSLDSKVLKSILVHLIPSAISYSRVCDGDARVIVMFALRRLLPILLPHYHRSTDLHRLFNDQILANLPISNFLNDHSPVPQYMIRLLSEIASVSEQSCLDLARILTSKYQHSQEPIIQSFFHLINPNSHFQDHSGISATRAHSPHESSHSSDPQVLIFLRQLMTSKPSPFFTILLKEGINQVLAESITFSIEKFNSELLLVLFEFLTSLLQECQNIDDNALILIPKSQILESFLVFEQIITPCLILLTWDTNRTDDIASLDPSILFVLQESVLKCFLLLLELSPDIFAESIVRENQAINRNRFSSILLNDKVYIFPYFVPTLIQWDIRLTSKFLNFFLKLLKVFPSLCISLTLSIVDYIQKTIERIEIYFIHSRNDKSSR
jgi:hypothetical protein